MHRQFLNHGRLLLLIIIYLLLSTGYNMIHTLGRGNDELAHFQYAQYIAGKHRLPVTFDERDEAGYKSLLPPLYHGLAAVFSSWVETKDVTFKGVKYGNIPQQALIYEVTDISWILPTEIMRFPYQGLVLRWHLSRLFSGILTAGVVAFTYFATLYLLPNKKTSALIAAASIAFIPRFVLSGASVTDDSLMSLLMALYLFLVLRLVRKNPSDVRDIHGWHFVFIGLTLGAAMITKATVWIIPLTVVLTLCFLAWQQGWAVFTLVKRVVVVGISTFFVTGWWFIFNIWYFNDIQSLGIVKGTLKAVLPNITNSTNGVDLLEVVTGVRESIDREPFSAWIVYFSKHFWAHNVPTWPKDASWIDGYPWILVFPLEPQIFWVSSLVTIVIIVGVALAWRRGNKFQRMWLGVLLLHFFSFFPFMLIRHYLEGKVIETAQGHHVVLPAALAIGILLMVGWTNWARPKTLKWLRPILPTLLLFWSIVQLNFLYQFPISLPVVVNASVQPHVENPVNQLFFNSIEFVGYNVDMRPEQAVLETTLVWQAHSLSRKDYLTEVRLVDQKGQVVSGWVKQAADGLYPTRTWFNGEIIYDQAKLPLFNVPPGIYTLEAYLLEAYQQPPVEAAGPMFSMPITIESVSNRQPSFKKMWLKTDEKNVEIGYQLWPFNFFDFSRPRFRFRSAIPITWESNLPVDTDKEVSLKLVGPDDHVFEPLRSHGNIKTFIVGPNWPSGIYRVKVEISEDDKIIAENLSAPWLEVQNKSRQFTPPVPTHPLEANFYNHIKLLGYDLPKTHLQPGEDFSVFVYWQSLQVVNGNLRMFNHLYDMDGNLRATFDRVPPPHYGGPIMWTPGQVITDGYTIPLEPSIPDGIYTLRAGFFLDLGNDAWFSLPLVDDQQKELDITYVTLGPVKIGSPPLDVLANDVKPQYPRNDKLGNLIELKGYDLDYSLDNQEIYLTLYWRSIASIDREYTTFVHLQNEAEETVAQKDGPPGGGIYPTSLWDVGEVIKDEVILPLPADVLTEKYKVSVGMYDFSTGERLTIIDSPDNSILITLAD